ncbi:hypothetical protein RIF23_17525 [Lipingzhangella sp. LS1_29]|uniref:Uncharacterized protein n=1 Tax=Lipingzhangella rawalii TaxID=2055835 RepID=A0ABU2H9V1_9ACTN|nr:hypothetical protein [Lipingzhangella rawalii]MDS1272093.1 hypothetical protein [Lipingzhangella rawalii]
MSDPVTVAIATAVAGKVAESLSDTAKSALKRLREAVMRRVTDSDERDTAPREALAAAQIDPEDPQAVQRLAAALSASDDPEVRRLVAELRPHFEPGQESVTNTVQGDVSGNVVMAKDIHGNISL